MGEIDDFASVLAAAQRGEPDALTTLYHSLQPKILRYLRGTLRDEAEDVAQEVWIQVATGITGFRGDEEDLTRWVFTIAIRRRIDAQRRQIRLAIPTGASLPDRPVDDRDVAATMYATELVRSLPPDQAEIIMLRVVAGFDAATVGELVGKSPGAVRVTAHRALTRLRTIVEHARTVEAIDRVASSSTAPDAIDREMPTFR